MIHELLRRNDLSLDRLDYEDVDNNKYLKIAFRGTQPGYQNFLFELMTLKNIKSLPTLRLVCH